MRRGEHAKRGDVDQHASQPTTLENNVPSVQPQHAVGNQVDSPRPNRLSRKQLAASPCPEGYCPRCGGDYQYMHHPHTRYRCTKKLKNDKWIRKREGRRWLPLEASTEHWKCPGCQNVNFERRSKCRRCTRPRLGAPRLGDCCPTFIAFEECSYSSVAQAMRVTYLESGSPDCSNDESS